MKLTPFAKFFITVVVLAVVGYAVYHYKGADVRKWATGDESGKTTTAEVSKGDFDALKNAPADAARDAGSTGVQTASLRGSGRLNRPLVVAINTWAGHAPGIVYNYGLDPNPNSQYQKKYNMEVKFVLIEDPAAKLAAFRKGDVDVMWDTVDNWAREASVLTENNAKAKSIMMQDWSRGGDGIVSLSSIKSIEDLKGHKTACTQFTPSHFLLLYLLSQSGLSPQDRAEVEKNIIFSTDAPAAAAMFKAKQVDAAVTWEPDLSAAVAARGDRAHVLVSTTAATNIIADTLVARQDIIDKAPETLRDFVHGWFEGIEQMKTDPAGSYAVVGHALKLDDDTVSGMLSGLKLTPYADNAQFYGLSGGTRALRDAVRHRVRDLAQEGTRHASRRGEGLGRHAVHRLARIGLRDAEGRRAEGRGEGAFRERPRDHQQADSDSFHARLGRDHARLVLRPRFPRRDDDVVRQHVPARRRQHRRHRLADGEHVALRAPRAGGEELHRADVPEH